MIVKIDLTPAVFARLYEWVSSEENKVPLGDVITPSELKHVFEHLGERRTKGWADQTVGEFATVRRQQFKEGKMLTEIEIRERISPICDFVGPTPRLVPRRFFESLFAVLEIAPAPTAASAE